jgi:uncharacterized protein involved in exopolysaccharide biosynthesis/Mrp family chromosome partitioning ATPase
MELKIFYNRLKRYKTLLILVPLFTGIIAFFLSRKVPDQYVSHARLASSMADKFQQLVSNNSEGEAKMNFEFNNLMQTLTLNKIVDRVSYKLILHDLDTAVPFRKHSGIIKELSRAQRSEAITAFTAYYNGRTSLNLSKESDKRLHKILKSMQYDYATLQKKIVASRMDNSQYINLQYSSENPLLSAYVLNTLSEEFIDYYSNVVNINKNKALQFLDSLMRVRQVDLAMQTESLKQYKIDNGILNIEDQAKNIYSQVADIETKKSTAEKDVIAYNMTLKNINSKFRPENRAYTEGSVSGVNSEIVTIKEQIKQVNDVYVQSGFDSRYKGLLDTLQAKLTAKIAAQADKYATNPLTAKDNLVNQKLTMETSRDLAQHSVKTFDEELVRLKDNLHRLVPNLATIEALESKIETANKEYEDILKRYNQATLEATSNSPVRVVEKAIPGDPAPDQKIVLVVLSFVVSFILCFLVIFIMFYFDSSIQSPEQLKNLVDINILGSLNFIKGSRVSLKDLWDQRVSDMSDKNAQVFKNALRSIRYEIENRMSDESRVISITSLDEGEGKTVLTESLAYAFSKVSKKVLIIDGNFMHPEISKTINGPNYLESFLLDDGDIKMVDSEFITVIGNRGGDGSLLELNSSNNIKDFFRVLRSVYDVILVETSSMDGVNKANAKEWISFSDSVVVVFESGRKVTGTAVQHIQYLKKLGDKLVGLVFNKVVDTYSVENEPLMLEKPKHDTQLLERK